MTMIPTADALIEDLYDFMFKACPEQHRVDVARTALLAAQYRAQQLARKRTAKAIERVMVERATLRASGGDRSVVGDGGLAISSHRPMEGETQ